MSSRSYLSIGDVLTLLRQEFPDVTISKIRFLESQGLVNPERTPSGYRKFYEHDVERLRWVLRQQREHFLPLKVIKDRLDDEPGTPDSSAPAAAGPAEPAPPATAEVAERHSSATHGGHHADEPVLVGQRVSSDAAAKADPRTRGEGPATRLTGGPTLPGIESSLNTVPGSSGSRNCDAREDLRPAWPRWPRRLRPTRPVVRAADRAPVPDRPPGPRRPPSPRRSRIRGRRRRPRPGRAERGRRRGSRRHRVSRAARPVPPRLRPPGPRRRPPVANRPAAPAGGDGVSLSVDELAASSGLEVSVVVELQEYGLLDSMVVAGLEYFDEDALAVATVAARFARFGIEPRHLRLYKNAADREAGFVEQIVLPLVRQRNPEARARAHETVDELSRLGQQLRAALLRNALETFSTADRRLTGRTVAGPTRTASAVAEGPRGLIAHLVAAE